MFGCPLQLKRLLLVWQATLFELDARIIWAWPEPWHQFCTRPKESSVNLVNLACYHHVKLDPLLCPKTRAEICVFRNDPTLNSKLTFIECQLKQPNFSKKQFSRSRPCPPQYVCSGDPLYGRWWCPLRWRCRRAGAVHRIVDCELAVGNLSLTTSRILLDPEISASGGEFYIPYSSSLTLTDCMQLWPTFNAILMYSFCFLFVVIVVAWLVVFLRVRGWDLFSCREDSIK